VKPSGRARITRSAMTRNLSAGPMSTKVEHEPSAQATAYTGLKDAKRHALSGAPAPAALGGIDTNR
jgi:hypothetical protein